uniref:Transmembrane protein n=1 Tax=Marseillevirus LCMAC101 TaxID=2506602 RepID=A0A481YRS0_9VIRU|nr:MAG: hypothetical protein LCMAC101_04960 [Marseillevirus LCMAC101]
MEQNQVYIIIAIVVVVLIILCNNSSTKSFYHHTSAGEFDKTRGRRLRGYYYPRNPCKALKQDSDSFIDDKQRSCMSECDEKFYGDGYNDCKADCYDVYHSDSNVNYDKMHSGEWDIDEYNAAQQPVQQEYHSCLSDCNTSFECTSDCDNKNNVYNNCQADCNDEKSIMKANQKNIYNLCMR